MESINDCNICFLPQSISQLELTNCNKTICIDCYTKAIKIKQTCPFCTRNLLKPNNNKLLSIYKRHHKVQGPLTTINRARSKHFSFM